MKCYLFSALGLSLLLTSCDTYVPAGPGYTTATVGVGVGYYDTLPPGWSNPYYRYNNRYYYGGAWELGRYYHNGRYYDGRYRHQGQYFYGGNYYPHAGHGHGHGHGHWH